MERTVFGTLPGGETVDRLTIRGGGLTAHVLTYGSLIQDLRLKGHAAPLVLGFADFNAYLAHSPYFGVTPGRCSNRIAGGRFSLDGTMIALERNERGVNHLHGGSDGIALRNWTVEEHDADRVVLSILDPAGRAGYPGNCRITATYALCDQGTLSVRYEAETDQPTLANLCQHSYFNLDGSPDILGHSLQIAADHYLPVDQDLIPTGSLQPVEGTVFDFRQERLIGEGRIAGAPVPYDHNFCLSPERRPKRAVARLASPLSGIAMAVHTTEPGVQFYAGGKMNVPVPGLDGRHYGGFAGLCLETQIWPDAANHPHFPSAVLRPGERLVQETDYVFSR